MMASREPKAENEPRTDTLLRASPSSSAVIGSSVSIKGQLFARENLTITGEIEGSVELRDHCLTVGPGGSVQADVKASEVIVFGAIHGNVECDKVDIRKDGSLVGDVKTARIIIEDGAYFKGAIDIQTARAKSEMALIGSREADELDRIAESDIEAGRYSTYQDDSELKERLLNRARAAGRSHETAARDTAKQR
jgi:cytoskeletal protein CcmA (bactofilin family)